MAVDDESLTGRGSDTVQIDEAMGLSRFEIRISERGPGGSGGWYWEIFDQVDAEIIKRGQATSCVDAAILAEGKVRKLEMLYERIEEV